MTLTTLSYAQNKDLDPIKWSFDSNQVGPEEYELIFRADFNSPWVVYSKDNGGDGPIPTSIHFTSKNVEIIGEAIEIGQKVKKQDELFGMSVINFEASKPFITKQKVKINDLSVPVKGYVTFMTCNNEVCLPPKDEEFSFTFVVTPPKTHGKVKKPTQKF